MNAYYSPRRVDAAAATRAAILQSGRDLFLAHGYEEVTVAQIARAARVAVPTVYSSTGGKAAILAALIAPAVNDPAVEETLTGIAATDDPREVVEITAAGTRKAHERNWETYHRLAVHLGPTDSSAREVMDAAIGAYLEALTIVADRLGALGALRPEVDRATAVTLLWFYLGQRAWFTLVGEQGWEFARAQAWLTHAAQHALLRPS